MTLKISHKMLKARNACVSHLDLFVKTFGRGSVPVTLRNVRKALAEGMDLRWLLSFLPADSYEKAIEDYTTSGYYRIEDGHDDDNPGRQCKGCQLQRERQARMFVRIVRPYKRLLTSNEVR